jgi:hypothetical protein
MACQEAPVLCSLSELDGYTNCLDTTGVGICPSPFCGTCDHYQWFSFIATSSFVQLEIQPSSCEGVFNGSGMQAMIFQTFDCMIFSPISNCQSPGEAQALTLTANFLEVGEVYHLMLDGWGGDICEYTIEVLEGGEPGTTPALIDSLSGDFMPCFSVSSYTYTAHTTPASAEIQWSVSPLLGTIQSGQGTNEVEIIWTGVGGGQLCASTLTDCGTGNEICMDVSVEMVPPVQLYFEACLGDTLICGGTPIPVPGSAITGDTLLPDGCLTQIVCIVNGIPPTIANFGKVLLCNDECFSAGDSLYCEAGAADFVIETGQNGCDSIVIFGTETIETAVSIAPPLNTSCEGPVWLEAMPEVVVSDTISPVLLTDLIWEGSGIIGNPSLFTAEVDQEGTYVVTVTYTQLGQTCTATDTVVIDLIGSPEIELLSYEVETSYITETGSIYPVWEGGTPPFTFEWSNGATTSFLEGVSFGNYEVAVTDDLGCIQSWDFQLGGSIGNPGAQFSSRPLKLWPNPLDEEELHLELPEGYDGPGTLELLSVHGQSVMRTEVGFAGGRGATKVGDLPAGVYFLRLQVGQDVWTERVQVF